MKKILYTLGCAFWVGLFIWLIQINLFEQNSETQNAMRKAYPLGINGRSGVDVEDNKTKQEDAKKLLPQDDSLINHQESDGNALIESFDLRLDKASEWFDVNAHSSQALQDAVNDPSLWDFDGNPVIDSLPLDEREKSDGRKFFVANPLKVAISMPGDEMSVVLPDTEHPEELIVNQVGSSTSGLITVSGQLKDDPSASFSMIHGDNFVAGHINTQSNTYSFEMFGDVGWIHSSGALFTGELPPVEVPSDATYSDHHSDSHKHGTDDDVVVILRGHHSNQEKNESTTSSDITDQEESE